MPNGKKLKVDLLVRPESVGSIVYGIFDTLKLTGIGYERLVHGEPGTPLVEVRIVSAWTEGFRCIGGVPIIPDAALAEADNADVIISANLSFSLEESPRGRFPEEVAWLRRQYERGATVATVCSGAVLLAETGLLDGQEATTHWAYSDFLKQHYPNVKLRPERVLTVAGENDRLVVAGSVASWQDLVLSLIGRFLGPAHAVRIAKALVLTDHAGGQLPYTVLTRHIQKKDDLIGECQQWIADNYAMPDIVQALLDLSGLPQRTFNRRFKAGTGYGPVEYVQTVRVEEAKQLLEASDRSIDDIAHAVGYEDPRSFHRLFLRHVGISPSAYRKKFGHKHIMMLR
jgi:transcriptional regulator GlxA family with amidase domain